jgi:mannose-6-phosphate isomerase-like protein (cupin superfamily)
MKPSPMMIGPADETTGGRALAGTTLAIGDWPAEGVGTEVAPLHVHHADDEAWYVVSGALRFRFADQELIAAAGSTVLVPAGVPHTFGNAGPEPSRFIIILPTRLDDLIHELHQTAPEAHPAVYRRYESELLE